MSQEAELLEEIRQLTESIHVLYHQLNHKKTTLSQTYNLLQQCCDHTFLQEYDDDYHKTRLYYVCSKCNLTKY